MLNATFYLSTVLIWGSTWLAIKYQLGSLTGTPVSSASTVPDLLSLLYLASDRLLPAAAT